jgi:hypothetical protein
MGKKAGAKSSAGKLDRALERARVEVARREKQLAAAKGSLADLEARRPTADADAAKPPLETTTAAKPAPPKKPAAPKPPPRSPETP